MSTKFQPKKMLFSDTWRSPKSDLQAFFPKNSKKAEKSEKNMGDRAFHADHFSLIGHPLSITV
jgi:hypothetical protein